MLYEIPYLSLLHRLTYNVNRVPLKWLHSFHGEGKEGRGFLGLGVHGKLMLLLTYFTLTLLLYVYPSGPSPN